MAKLLWKHATVWIGDGNDPSRSLKFYTITEKAPIRLGIRAHPICHCHMTVASVCDSYVHLLWVNTYLA